jgi:hypothetical protein
MSTSLNKFQPLPPMPPINQLPPGNIISKKFDSFPPIKTPKLQELNKERVTYPTLGSIKIVKPKVSPPTKKKEEKRIIKRQLKKLKKLRKPKICNLVKCNNECKYKICIFIKSFILCSVIYFILSSIVKL